MPGGENFFIGTVSLSLLLCLKTIIPDAIVDHKLICEGRVWGVGCGVWGVGNFWSLGMDIYDCLENSVQMI